jgi:hypothetical protein
MGGSRDRCPHGGPRSRDMRDGNIAVWEAAFNINEVGKPSAMGLV